MRLQRYSDQQKGDDMQPKPTNHEEQRSLAQLVSNTERHLETLHYAPSTIARYRSTWRSFVHFSEQEGVSDRFSEELAEQFVAARGVSLAVPAKQSIARHLRAAMGILGQFARCGYIHRRRRAPVSTSLQPSMAAALKEYTRYCRLQAQHSPKTVRLRRNTVARFLEVLEARSVTELSAVTPADINAFIGARRHLALETLAVEMSTLRSFLRVLFALGRLSKDLSEYVPRVRWRRYGRIPSVWKPSDVDAVLRAVDRSSPLGKRNYAILLFACRLGMRSGDIRDLRLDDLHWDQAIVSVQQSKTGRDLELPMTDELASALIDYLRCGRPTSGHREVFLRFKAPFEPLANDNNLYGILTKYRRLAGVKLDPQARRGLHSLRHTVATRLLADGVPIHKIGLILGHTSIETTRIYTMVDIEALRSAALEPDDESNE
jgi:site-specific recombinase XerD